VDEAREAVAEFATDIVGIGKNVYKAVRSSMVPGFLLRYKNKKIFEQQLTMVDKCVPSLTSNLSLLFPSLTYVVFRVLQGG
jgi:hypothetical protein